MAGPDGIQEGQEVTISYGSHWPNEAFLLLFGFTPDGNTADAVVLFPSMKDLVGAWLKYQRIPSTMVSRDDEIEQVKIILSHPELAEGVSSGEFDRLLVTHQGIDSRMGEAVSLVARAAREASVDASSSGMFVEATGTAAFATEQRLFLLDACIKYKDRLDCAAARVGSSIVPPAAFQFRSQKVMIINQAIQGLSS